MLCAGDQVADDREHELRDADADKDQPVAADAAPPGQQVDQRGAAEGPDPGPGQRSRSRRSRTVTMPATAAGCAGGDAHEIGRGERVRQQLSGTTSRRPRAQAHRERRSCPGQPQVLHDEVDAGVVRDMEHGLDDVDTRDEVAADHHRQDEQRAGTAPRERWSRLPRRRRARRSARPAKGSSRSADRAEQDHHSSARSRNGRGRRRLVPRGLRGRHRPVACAGSARADRRCRRRRNRVGVRINEYGRIQR